MKFATQHIRVMGKDGYNLHRDSNVTWRTSMATTGDISPYNVIEHDSVADAKQLLGNITCASH